MKIRDYKKEDAQIITGWIRSEDELYKWSADRFNKYPLSGDDINENYAPQLETGRFIPLTAVNDNGEVAGHFIIRYPNLIRLRLIRRIKDHSYSFFFDVNRCIIVAVMFKATNGTNPTPLIKR